MPRSFPCQLRYSWPVRRHNVDGICRHLSCGVRVPPLRDGSNPDRQQPLGMSLAAGTCSSLIEDFDEVPPELRPDRSYGSPLLGVERCLFELLDHLPPAEPSQIAALLPSWASAVA